jgi:glycosyltransferase involved in cell wall biosynthesis
MDSVFAWAALVCAGIPALLFLWNVFLYRAPVRTSTAEKGVSVLIPARNEEHTIGAAVTSVLANIGMPLEVIVLDDESTDGTAKVLRLIATVDPRLRIVRGSKIPVGWCGKQHACAQLATHARYPLLCFMDADVVLQPDALVRMMGFLEQTNSHLISGVPRQLTGSFLERLLIPLIHFVLLGFLPIFGMRRSLHPSFAAGCGQLFLARAESYHLAGGHAAIRSTLHDGINLPKAFRRAGLKTDLFDATRIASCRMYRSGSEVWQGLKKNATEGLGAPQRIGPMSAVLLLGQVLPFFLILVTSGQPQTLFALAIAACYTLRVISALRFRQSLIGAVLHPLGILLLLTIQWQALVGHLSGARVQWKGRAYAGPAGS